MFLTTQYLFHTTINPINNILKNFQRARFFYIIIVVP